MKPIAEIRKMQDKAMLILLLQNINDRSIRFEILENGINFFPWRGVWK